MTEHSDIVNRLDPLYCRDCGGFYQAAEGYCPRCGPAHAPPNRPKPVDNGDETSDEREPTTWLPVDLTDALAGIDTPAPQLWTRTDGVPLLYRGRVHWFHGETESCKSWAAQQAAAQVLDADGRVLYIDFEDDAPAVVARLLAMSVAADSIAKRFAYLHPDEPLMDQRGRTTGGGLDFLRVINGDLAGPWDLAVVDGVTEAMTIEGLALIDNADVATWLRRVPKRLALDDNIAVVCIDHVSKGRDERGRYAIGGQHKLAGLSGAAYTFTGLRPFARARGAESVTGTVSVDVAKDRPGHVRGRAVGNRIAILSLTSYPDGGVSAALTPPSDEPPPDLALAVAILAHLRLYDGSSMRQIEDGVEGRATSIRSCLKWLAADERAWIRTEQRGRSHLHWLTDAGREQVGGDDDRSR
jgi:AAA domain